MIYCKNSLQLHENYCPLLAQCKATQNKIAWAHCMFFADQVAQLLDIRIISSTPNYVLVTTALIAAKIEY